MDKRFREIAEYAYESVPLYMRREKGIDKCKDWTDIPILKKEEILNHADSFYSCSFFGADGKKVMKRKTSGSTGKYLELYWHVEDYKKSLIPVWIYRKKYYNINPSDKMCYFYTTSNIGYRNGIEYEEEEKGNVKGFSKNNLNHERTLEIYRKIVEYNPIWLFLQPSMAVLLCDAAEETGLKIEDLKYIEFSGEMLAEEVRKRTEKIFGCRTANHYGCNEVNTVAFECPYGNMHVAGNDIYVEVVDEETLESVDDGEEGSILITSAVNRVMPFIRYQIGDRGRLKKGIKCRCGCRNPAVEITNGRISDDIELSDGTRINSYIFVHAVEMVNRDMECCIQQYQIVQKDYEHFLVRLAVNEEIFEINVTEEMIEKKFVANILHPEMENMKYEFEFYNQLFPEDNNGKLLWFRRGEIVI